MLKTFLEETSKRVRRVRDDHLFSEAADSLDRPEFREVGLLFLEAMALVEQARLKLEQAALKVG